MSFSHIYLSGQVVCHQTVMMRKNRVMTAKALSTATSHADHPYRGPSRALWVACGAHALHDGLTDTLYLLLPILQTEFALTYAAIGVLRALYAGAMAGLQVPAAKLAQRIGGPSTLYWSSRLSSGASDRAPNIRLHRVSSPQLIRGRARAARLAPTILPEISARWRCQRSPLV